MKRANLVLDEASLEEATRLSGEKTYSAAVMRALEDFVRRANVATCLPVIQEVLQAFRDEAPYPQAREAMLALPIVDSPIAEGPFLHAVDLYRSARRAGLAVRSSVDRLVAACAIRHDQEVLHRDRDYPALAEVSALRQRSP